ncbi:MAG: molybdenum ABC transporter ATP-binding protein [Rhodobiaceae bacterium]|nr:MAG: molybdenum ABC transporter ATP-binding protein [Rhodobiaceae bacterium]
MTAYLSLAIKRKVGSFALTVDAEIGDGITGIIGPSGAGKTMLINTVAGLVRPDSGKIVLNGKALFDSTTKTNLAPEKRDLGLVFQDARLFPHMSVQSNLTYARRNDRPPLAAINEIVELLNLSHLLKRRPHHLSGGEKQRVAIGRALLSAPVALLMDEPLANLDLARRREVMPFLEMLRERFKVPILYVSHNLDETIRLADRVLVMDHGEVVAEGAVENVLSRIDVQSLILGGLAGDRHPEPVTIVSATIRARHDDGLYDIDTPWGTLTAPEISGAPGQHIRLRLHAHDIVLASAAPDGLSIRNVIAGEVGTMTEAGPAQIDVLVRPFGPDGTPTLWARVTRRAVEEMNLQPGMPIWALLKAVVLASDIDLDGLR